MSNKIEDKELEGEELAEKIMDSLYGVVGIVIGGQIVRWSSELHTGLHIDDVGVIDSVDLPKFLTQHEQADIRTLPFYNGNNSYDISMKCLLLVEAAIRRRTGIVADPGLSHYPEEDKQAILWGCRCSECCKREAEDL